MLSSEDSGSIQNPMKRAMGLPPASDSDMLKVVPSWPASEGEAKMIELLTNNHLEKILDLFDGANRDIRIISPFLSVAMAQRLCDSIRERGLRCAFITRFYIEDMVAKANSIDALEMLLNAGVDLYAVKRLHTKLYLFDHDQAIVGSANFTTGGFKSNIELSLAIGDQPDLLSELSGYFDDMEKKLKAADDGRVTHEMIEKARAIYMNVYRSKQRTNIVSRNYTMFGAALDRKSEFRDGNAIWAELDACQGETDLVSDLFRELEQQEQIIYPFNIWLKFDGEADHRLEATDPFPMTDFDLPSGKVYLSNYPFRVSSIKEGDEVYFAGLTTSKNGRNLPVIIGRGRLTGFTGKNHVTDVMIAQYPWMQRFPWYVTISECDVLDAPLVEGIPLDEVWDALGSGTYLASFGRHESIPAVSRKHYQKAHIRLSGNAKQYIDKRLDTLFEQFGTIHYVSAT